MKLDRFGNVKKGIVYGIIDRFLSLIFPFIIQTIIIHQLGTKYVGVKGLFGSILTVFSLAELGFGTAVVFAMYKPIAEDNVEVICALLNLFKRIYKYIGMFILLLGVCIIPFLDLFVKDSYPNEVCIEIVFLLYLLNTVVPYFLFGYRSSLLNAYQRTDVLSIVNTSVKICSSILQIVLLYIFKSFYLFLIIELLATIANNFYVSIMTRKMFPGIVCKGKVGNESIRDIKKKVFAIFISKICGVTRNSFDAIFMSAFLGLTLTAIYSNYFMILSALNSFTSVVMTSLLGGVGNSIVLESKEKNYNDMMLLNNVYMIISGIMSVCMLCMYQPFMYFWVGKENLFSPYIMIMFPLYFYIEKMGDIRGVYSDAAGLFQENKRRCIIEAIANIILNYFLGKYLGAFGILLATNLTLFFIGFLGSTIVIFKYYFSETPKIYLINQIVFLLSTVLISAIVFFICETLFVDYTLVNFLLRGGVCFLLTLLLYWLFFRKTKAYKTIKERILIKR